MASEFDHLTKDDGEYVRKRLMAGDKMADILAVLPGLTAYRLRLIRDELFDGLVCSPAAVKALAEGPMLNPLDVVRYTHSRKVVSRKRLKQADLFAGA